MSEMICLDGISQSFFNLRLTTGDPVHRPVPDPDAAGGVAVSRMGRSLRRIVEQSSMRRARIRAIQSEIETGTYETSDRISGTVDRLLELKL